MNANIFETLNNSYGHALGNIHGRMPYLTFLCILYQVLLSILYQ